MLRRLATLAMVLLGAWLMSSCARRLLPAAQAHDQPPTQPGPLSVHLAAGDLIVLSSWQEEPGEPAALVGPGTRYDAHRRPLGQDTFRIPYDSIVLLETTVTDPADLLVGEGIGGGVLAVFTGLTSAITLACLADPKSCFGSCPTFYAGPDDDRPVAEAFSGSVARVLEARDIDALPTVRARAGHVRLRMRNEALETHAIRLLRLLAVQPGAAGVAAAPGHRFLQLDEVVEPVRCAAPEGDCLDAVRRRDGTERRSWTDSTDLSAREVIDLEFPATTGPLGLLVSARHTFVSTFVFYQMMAYLGADAGHTLAALERGDPALREAFERGVSMLGEVRVLVEGPGGWVEAATYAEAGPLASDIQVVPLPTIEGPVRVRLEMTRGYWRADQLALARLGPDVQPLALPPARAERAGSTDERALTMLLDPDRYLVTYPGDAYDLVFDLPDSAAGAALFLDATGHYYEWMRQEWLAERDPAMTALLMIRPRALFRRIAPAFKASEERMEELFWASRFGR